MYLVYDGFFDKIRRFYFKKIINKYQLTNKRILDYGAGPGDMMFVAKEVGAKAYGIDLFKRSVDLGRDRGLNIELGDYHQMTKIFKKSFFDAIFLQSVMEHIKDPIKELSQLKPYLKKGGLLIVSSPTPSTHFWDDPTHVRPYTPKSLKVLTEVLDMELIEVNYVLSFLLNINLQSRLIYLLLNILPISLGSNLIAVYKRR